MKRQSRAAVDAALLGIRPRRRTIGPETAIVMIAAGQLGDPTRVGSVSVRRTSNLQDRTSPNMKVHQESFEDSVASAVRR